MPSRRKPARKPMTTAAKTARAPAARFTGFAREAPGFFHQLAAEMTREWFTAHKHEYEALWVQPMTALLAEVAARLKPAYRGLTVHDPKLFRIYRDVRFGADKSPYKTHCAGVIGVSKTKEAAKPTESSAALYLHLGAEDEYCGAGHYIFEPDTLARWRKLVANNKSGAEIQKLVTASRALGMKTEAHEILARVPKPYDADHPRAELLRYKGLIVGFPAIPRGLIHRATFADWLVARATEAAPLVGWLAKKLG